MPLIPRLKKLLRLPLRPGVFIVGTPHSGTSLLTAMLDSHPRMASIPTETGVFFIAPKKIDQTLEGFEEFARARGVRRWVEKTPDHLLHWETLREKAPRNPVVLMIRDGRDVVASLKARFEDFEKAMEVWQRSATITADLLEADPGSDWRGPLVPVHYEALVNQPEQVMREICAGIGEKFDPAMLEFHRNQRDWYSKAEAPQRPPDASQKNHSQWRNWQINQPLFNNSGRWKRDLTEAEQRRFNDPDLRKLLGRLGYDAAAGDVGIETL